MKNQSYFLAVHDGHNASCALMKDDEIIVVGQEERLTRKKNQEGYPKKSIDFCLRKANIKGSDLARVAFTTRNWHPSVLMKSHHSTQFTIQDYLDYYGEKYYARKFRGENCLDYLKWLRDADKFNEYDTYYDFSWLTDDVLNNSSKDAELFFKERKRTLARHLDIPSDKVEFLDHHTCHAYYAYFGSPFRGKDCIAVTLDGWGDGRNQTVWKVSNDKLTLIAESDQNELGRIYKMTTLILGMRPDEHEYKVMGLAPYAKDTYVRKSLEVIKDVLQVDKIRILHKNRPKDLWAFLKKVFGGHRFDNIAGAVQLYTETIVKQLFKNIHNKTGIKWFVLSGGIAMNVKMNKALQDLDCVDSFFVCGSGGDESLSIGGCYYLNQNCYNQPLKNLYLGHDINSEFASFNWASLSKDYNVLHNITNAEVARLLTKGDIIARVFGRAEFGARALGHRSILADPSKKGIIMQINEAIKKRDFWMPFALSILEDHADKYIYNPKRISAPFMSTAFDTLPDLYQNIHAGTHPYDRTIRPQCVSKENSPDFYDLIEEFYKITGIPAILNTSLNLHGEPIVNSITDAVRTFKLSDLDHLLVQNTLVSKNK